MVSRSFIHVNGSNITTLSEDSDILSHKQWFSTFLIMSNYRKIKRNLNILMLRAHIDKVKSPAFRFHTAKSQNPPHI